MKPRTVILLACSLIAICLCHGCGGRDDTGAEEAPPRRADVGKPSHQYADIEEFSDQYMRLIEEYAAAMDRADSAQAVATAINRFADGIEKLGPAMQRLREKYPELEDNQDLPEEVKKLESRMEEAGMKMVQAMMKAAPYMGDPEVQKAQARLDAAWQE